MRFVFAILCLAAVVVARDQQNWTNLKVHFSLNAFSSYFYKSVPRQVVQSSDWINLSGNDCTNGGKYYGFRQLAADSNGGMALLYDIQGTVAGIQQILKMSEVSINNVFNYAAVPAYNPDTLNGEAVWVITAYFVDPQSICAFGRNTATLNTFGTGSGIQIQNGPTPASLLSMPRYRPDAIAQGWTQDKCFVGMGFHNFYKVEEMASKDCSEIVPFFGLYDNNGDQIGLGFAATGKGNSNYFENPSSGAVKLIVGADLVPQCLLNRADNPGLTTMHVFFTDSPNRYGCVADYVPQPL